MAGFSAACKTIHMSPLPKQYNRDYVGVVESRNPCMTSDQGQILVSESNLMEMTEVEYTNIQHIIETHMEAYPDESETNAVFALGNLATQPGTVKDDAESMVVLSPMTTQVIDLSTSADAQSALSEPSPLQIVAIQGMKMVLAGDAVGVLGERTPTTSGEVPGSVLAKMNGTLLETPANNSTSLLTRPDPPARVCLEKRYNFTPGHIPRQQDIQTSALSNFLTVLHQSTEAEEAATNPQIQMLMRSDQVNPIELSQAYKWEGNFFSTIAGMCGQAFGHIPHMIEPSKNQNLVTPKNYSFNYRERVTQCISCTDPAEEQQSVEVENDAVAKTASPIKRIRRIRGPRSRKAAIPAPDSKEVNSYGTSTRKRAKPALEGSQRRENHNSKERERRRKIRQCCDELNMLVPDCTLVTDKATTLQRTVSFLKHITEVHGESLKQGFQNASSSKTEL